MCSVWSYLDLESQFEGSNGNATTYALSTEQTPHYHERSSLSTEHSASGRTQWDDEEGRRHPTSQTYQPCQQWQSMGCQTGSQSNHFQQERHQFFSGMRQTDTATLCTTGKLCCLLPFSSEILGVSRVTMGMIPPSHGAPQKYPQNCSHFADAAGKEDERHELRVCILSE